MKLAGLLSTAAAKFRTKVPPPAAITDVLVNSGMYAMSGNGLVVGGYSLGTPDWWYKAAHWSQSGGLAIVGTLNNSWFSRFVDASFTGTYLVGTGSTTSGGYGPQRALRWSQGGGFEDLGVIATGTGSQALACSADGSVVVGHSTVGGIQQPFRWTSAGGMVNLALHHTPANTAAYACSDDGSVVVGITNISSPLGQRAFRWTQGTGSVDLGTLGGYGGSSASDCSADGSVVVGKATNVSLVYRAFRWTQGGGMVDLGSIGTGTSTEATKCSPNGNIVYGSSRDNNNFEKAFKWTQGTGIVSLGNLPANNDHSYVSDASTDGTVIVGTELKLAEYVPYIWYEGVGKSEILPAQEILDLIDTEVSFLIVESVMITPDGSQVFVTWQDDDSGEFFTQLVEA